MLITYQNHLADSNSCLPSLSSSIYIDPCYNCKFSKYIQLHKSQCNRNDGILCIIV